MTRDGGPGKRRVLAMVSGILLLLLGLSSLLSALSQFVNALAGAYGGVFGSILTVFVLGAGLTFTGQWLLRRGGTEAYEAQTTLVFKLLGGGLILVGVFAGGCSLIFAGAAFQGDPYAKVGVYIGAIVGVVALGLGWLFWKASTIR